MNITEALKVALPDLPARALRRGYPRLHPLIVTREHLEDGEPILYAIVSGANQLYRFTPEQWQLMQLFNGERSYQEVSNLFQAHTGISYTPEDIQEYVSDLQEIWYTAPEAANVTAAQKGAENRHRAANKKIHDITTIECGHWDPDTYLDWLQGKLKFVYSAWFTWLTVASFALMAVIFIARWGEIGADTWKYYDFTQKGLGDIAEFWLLFCFLGFFHESAHGLTCKHFGGAVHKMGFLLYYLEPCFYVDVTEVYVYAGKWARIATSIAGIWVELTFCVVATILWSGTPVGTPVHEFCYKIILVTGVGVAIINLNPLIKLDGYYILCELVGIIGLKEDSTAFVSSWVKKNILRLPVEVEFVPRRRRILFAVYAILSGIYSYALLYVAVTFSYHVFRKYSPEWAFVPSALLALLIFKSRLRALVRLMKTLYLDKREQLRAWLSSPHLAVISLAAAMILFAPVFPETRAGRFSLEPIEKAVIRATVPGEVTAVLAQEGRSVPAGGLVLEMRNLDLESRAAKAGADLSEAAHRTTQARLQYADYSKAEKERESLQEQTAQLQIQLAALQVRSPIAGSVATPRVRDLAGAYVTPGTLLMEVADTSVLRARIYVPEFDMRGIQVGSRVSLKLDSLFQQQSSTVNAIAPVASPLEPGLIPIENYKGMNGESFYSITALVPNRLGGLRPGMSGTGKILIARRSLAGLAWKTSRDFVGRKIW